MPLFLVKVTEKSPRMSITIGTFTREYEVEAPNLTGACLRVVDAPPRHKGEGYVERRTADPYTNNYVEPDASRYAAMGIAFPQGDRDCIAKVAELAGLDPEAERMELARAVGKAQARKDEANFADMIVGEGGWADRSVEENAASLRNWVEREWYDEEVEGRSWFHELESRLETTKILAGPSYAAAARESYWAEVGEIAAEVRAQATAPSP